MLALAGANPMHFCLLTMALQTGARVGELCNLRIEHIDLQGRTIRIRAGKGMVSRELPLENNGIKALKNWLAVRPVSNADQLFLNYQGDPISDRGVRKLVVSYARRAGITKRVSPHSLRHSLASYKAERGVSPFQLQQWLGHANLNTTQIYVHLARQNGRKVMEATAL